MRTWFIVFLSIDKHEAWFGIANTFADAKAKAVSQCGSDVAERCNIRTITVIQEESPIVLWNGIVLHDGVLVNVE